MDDGAVDLGISGLTGAVEVARGGFSTIYRATQATMERTVAVKLIHATVVDPRGRRALPPRGPGDRAPLAASQRRSRL